MNPITKSLQQIRWKLALSYAGVTVLALLTVEVLFFAVMGMAVMGLLRSGAIPRELIRQVSLDFVPSLQPHLSETPPNVRGIADVLALAEASTARTIPLSFDIQDFLVVGRDRYLLGSSPQDLFGEDSIGQRLDIGFLPELAGPLLAALEGEEDFDRLYVVGEPGGIVVLAVPVWDSEHQGVLGVFIGLAESPTPFSLMGEAAPYVGVSLLAFTAVAGVVGVGYGFLAARGPVDRLGRLANAAEAWGRGDFSAVVQDPAADELGELARRLNHMALQLEHLFEMRQELAVLRERNRLARDLHDSVKQLAFATAAQIGTARTLIAREPAQAKAHVDEAERLTHELRQELSSLILELAPPALEDKGLTAALREYSDNWSRQNGIEVLMHVDGERSLPLSISEAVFRIAQEALANVARHSRARLVEIDLAVSSNAVRFSVEDDGVGFEIGDGPDGFGQHSMEQRAAALGGELLISSERGVGTRVCAMLPIGESGNSLEAENG